MFRGNIFTGAGYLFEAFGLLLKPDLRPYVLIPLLINIVVFSVVGWMVFSWVDTGTNWALSFIPDWLAWVTYLIMPAVVLVFLLGVFFTFNFVANIVAAPFNGMLAEKVSLRVTPNLPSYEESIAKLVNRTLRREMAKLGYYLPRIIALTIISWIPVVNFAAPALWFIFTAWMVAFQYIDFAADNQGPSIDDVKAFLKEKPLTTISMGTLITIILTVPILNFIVIPLAVIAGTLYWQRSQPEAKVTSESEALIEAK